MNRRLRCGKPQYGESLQISLELPIQLPSQHFHQDQIVQAIDRSATARTRRGGERQKTRSSRVVKKTRSRLVNEQICAAKIDRIEWIEMTNEIGTPVVPEVTVALVTISRKAISSESMNRAIGYSRRASRPVRFVDMVAFDLNLHIDGKFGLHRLLNSSVVHGCKETSLGDG